ncbi:MAG TPA: hypothetical protein VG389_21210 [Myxococcota bacterium]|jgi:hypothetical protein|nr:hypothetical protein [Myxococcota bacterium]
MSSPFAVRSCSLFLAAALAALGAPGCAEILDAEHSDASLAIASGDAALILAAVNYPGTTFTVLDAAAGLDSRAAQNIVDHRNGADGVTPSADDNLFGDVAELDAIAYVGDVAFEKLLAFAQAHPAPAAESVEGVLFLGWESESVVWGVGHATVEELDVGAALESRAASNLVTARPFTSVTQMGPVAYVGAVALGALRAYADVWWAQMHDAAGAPALAGTFDGVAFDEATAHVALDVANGATQAELVAHGMYSTGASHVVAARPYATLAAVAAVDGVGTATMNALHAYAASGDWAPAPPAGYVLTTEELAGMVQLLKEGMWEDEGFIHDVADLAAWDEALIQTIMTALEAQMDLLAAPMAGTSWTDYDAAHDAVVNTAGAPKGRTRNEGWAYLESIGVAH